jgi:hypothetical protein
MVLLFNGLGFCPLLIFVCFVVVLDRFDIEIYADFWEFMFCVLLCV